MQGRDAVWRAEIAKRNYVIEEAGPTENKLSNSCAERQDEPASVETQPWAGVDNYSGSVQASGARCSKRVKPP